VNEKELLDLINQQDKIIKGNMDKGLMQIFEDEFVMTNVMRGYVNYLIKNNQMEKFHSSDINELISKKDVPVKKISCFDISRHDVQSQMYYHKHTYLELDYVYRGSCSYYIHNDNTMFQLREKELCIVNQNVIHGIKAQNDEDIIIKCMIPFESIHLSDYMQFADDIILKRFLTHTLDKNYSNASYVVLQPEDFKIDDVMARLFSENIERRSGWEQVTDHKLSVLFIDLMRISHNHLRLVTDTAEDEINITNIIQMIQKNYQYISLKDMAEDLHFHENYLSRLIRQQAGQSFRDLLCRIRLNEAERLLLDTDLSVSEIAARLGYMKPNYFYKLFKEHYGATPMEYKIRSKKQRDNEY